MSATSQPTQSSPPADPASSRRTVGGALSVGKRFLTLREGSIIVVTIIAAVYFSTQTSRFLTTASFQTLLPFFAPFAIIAAGEVFVMINGEIDLSVGTMGLFIAFWFHQLHTYGLPLVPALILALASALALGAFNGFMTAYVGISSFVTTLGMLFFLGGLTLVLSHSTQVNLPGTSILGHGGFEKIFGRGTYSELFWAVGIVIVLQVMLSFTRWGIHTVAVGSNRIGAAEAGIRRAPKPHAQLHDVRDVGRPDRDPRERPRDHAQPGSVGDLKLPVPQHLGRGDRRHAAAGRLWHGGRGIHRRAVPRHPDRRADADRHQRRPS